MKLRRMILPLALLIVLGLVAWRLVRGIHESPAAPSAAASQGATPAAPAASETSETSEASGPRAAPAAAAAQATTAPPPSPAPSGPRPTPVATPTAAPLPPGAGSSMRAAGSGAGSASPAGTSQEEGLKDRTGGWGQAIIRQLNKELMPLASECIDQAVARNPKLEGTLALDLVVVPVDAKKAIVESVTPSAYNQIKDDELVECIRQSSFAMEGLGAPYNFTLSMPIKPTPIEPVTK